MTDPIQANGADTSGAMVALEVPPDLAPRLTVEGGEPADRLHVTLAYFDDAADDRDDWNTLRETLKPIVEAHGEVRATLSGQGFFEQDDGRVHWVSVDAPGLSELRDEIVAAAEEAGFAVRHDHGFQPHVTVAYADADSEPPTIELPEGEVPFGTPKLYAGGEKMLLTAAARVEGQTLEIEGQEVPLAPPADWFEPPAGGIPTDRRITVEAGGRVYGYIALWNACHVGAQGCVPPPKGSPTDYELSHPGQTVTADGETVRTANIGGDVGHAPGDLSAWDAASFYENVATQLMRVRYGEDENGLWFAGALWPDLSPTDVARIQAASISGDWRWEATWRRNDDGGFDYTGAVLVNLPGFPLEADGGASTKSGFLDTIAASARKAGFRGIVSCGETFIDVDEFEQGDATVAERTADGSGDGGCGCGGKQNLQIKAGSFVGTVDQLVETIMTHLAMALGEVDANDGGDVEGAPAEVDVEEIAARAVRAAVEGDAAGAGDSAVEALNMKLDTVLEKLTVIEAASVESQAERLASKAGA